MSEFVQGKYPNHAGIGPEASDDEMGTIKIKKRREGVTGPCQMSRVVSKHPIRCIIPKEQSAVKVEA